MDRNDGRQVHGPGDDDEERNTECKINPRCNLLKAR
jgi:hypothetical protein